MQLIELEMTLPKENLSSSDEKATDEFSVYRRRVCETVFEYAMTAPSLEMETVQGTLFGSYNRITSYFQKVQNYRSAEGKMNSLLYSLLGEMRSRKAFRLCEGFASNGYLIP